MRIEGSVTGMESERSYSAVNYSARSLKLNMVTNGGIADGGMYRRGSGAGTYREGGLGKKQVFYDTLTRKNEPAENDGGVLSGKPVRGKDYSGDGGSDFVTELSEEGRTASLTDIMDSMMGVSRYMGRAVNGSFSVVRYGENAVGIRDKSTDTYAGRMAALYIFSLLFEDFRKRVDELMAGVREQYEDNTRAEYSGNSKAGELTGRADPQSIGDYRWRTAYTSGSVFGFEMSRDNVYIEKECTAFKARGKAVCADGREIDFDINVGMSRRFEKISKERMSFDPVRCMDPLVINLKEGVTSVSDKYIYFDLDGDGEAERIKSLSENSGYIALDKNGDGIINDGSELFGTKSGDGFADLAAYDSDGDGWIDEDDEIFDKLKVWVGSGDGADSLLSFRDAGIGAINLANSLTEFSLKDEQNRTDAIIGATGMFLYEDGRAGTVQQVDMVS